MGTAESPFLRITEIFHSIQGESTWSGLPCTFVRLTGCPLRCVWCDTEYAFHGGTRLTLDEIVEEVRSIGTSLVEITGGEPLAHPNAYVLAERLLDEGFTVLVETSGAFDVAPARPPGTPDHGSQMSWKRGGRQEPMGEPGPPDGPGRGEVRRTRPDGLRMGERHDR